jgi:hypothetical protein
MGNHAQRGYAPTVYDAGDFVCDGERCDFVGPKDPLAWTDDAYIFSPLRTWFKVFNFVFRVLAWKPTPDPLEGPPPPPPPPITGPPVAGGGKPPPKPNE